MQPAKPAPSKNRLLPALAAAFLLFSEPRVVLCAGGEGGLPGPRIDRIELLEPGLVTVHFDTEADRTYDLEYQDLASRQPGVWKLLFSAPAIPFANHYVVADERIPGGRLYRLRISP